VETSKGATPCALALPVVAMAYACHFNIVAIDRELPKTRRGKACVGKVIHASMLAGKLIILLILAFLHVYGQLD
jgi:amino acid permease